MKVTKSALVFATAALLISGSGCALFTTRPLQEMSDTSAALKAAREAQADVHAPELYRQAQEWWFKARQEYKFKQFSYALDYSEKARLYAEQAEYFALQKGAVRQDISPPEPIDDSTLPADPDSFERPRPVPYNPNSGQGGGQQAPSSTPSAKQ